VLRSERARSHDADELMALWAVIGFLVAPRVLRRMARRESGSRVRTAREKAMKRAY
jgi:ABC-2 type transport system permease protein